MEPAIFECPSCRGHGCRECGEVGTFTYDHCVRGEITAAVWSMLYWVNQYLTNHLAPEDGGALSQTQSFNDSLSFIKGEFDQWDARLRLGGK